MELTIFEVKKTWQITDGEWDIYISADGTDNADGSVCVETDLSDISADVAVLVAQTLTKAVEWLQDSKEA